MLGTKQVAALFKHGDADELISIHAFVINCSCCRDDNYHRKICEMKTMYNEQGHLSGMTLNWFSVH